MSGVQNPFRSSTSTIPKVSRFRFKKHIFFLVAVTAIVFIFSGENDLGDTTTNNNNNNTKKKSSLDVTPSYDDTTKTNSLDNTNTNSQSQLRGTVTEEESDPTMKDSSTHPSVTEEGSTTTEGEELKMIMDAAVKEADKEIEEAEANDVTDTLIETVKTKYHRVEDGIKFQLGRLFSDASSSKVTEDQMETIANKVIAELEKNAEHEVQEKADLIVQDKENELHDMVKTEENVNEQSVQEKSDIIMEDLSNEIQDVGIDVANHLQMDSLKLMKAAIKEILNEDVIIKDNQLVMATETTMDEIDSSSNTTEQVGNSTDTVVEEVSMDGNLTNTSNTTTEEASTDDGNSTDTTTTTEEASTDGNLTNTSNTTTEEEEEASTDDGNSTDTTTTTTEEEVSSTDNGNSTDATIVEEEEDPSEIDEMMQNIDSKTIGEDIQRATEGETINEEEEEATTTKINEEESSETAENAKVDE